MVADMGYYNQEELKQCEEAGITAYVSKPIVSKNTARGLFGKEKFVYEARWRLLSLSSGERFNVSVSKPANASKRSFVTIGRQRVWGVRSRPSVRLIRNFAGSSGGNMKRS